MTIPELPLHVERALHVGDVGALAGGLVLLLLLTTWCVLDWRGVTGG